MNNELKPCPFCGGEVRIAVSGNFECEWYYVTRGFKENTRCDCRLFMETYPYPIDTSDEEKQRCKDELIKCWNTRYERTCKWVYDSKEDLYVTECGNVCYYPELLPNYCSNCGAKVIDK